MTYYAHSDDRADVMADLLDGFTVYVHGAEKGLTNAGKYRSNLLWVHSVAALLIAPLLVATGREGIQGPAFALLRQLPGMPGSVASLIGTGGFVLGVGAILGSRPVQIVGLSLLGVFYATLALGFSGAIWLYFTDGLTAKPTLYAPVLYLHLTVIMFVHMAGLLRRGRGGRDDD